MQNLTTEEAVAQIHVMMEQLYQTIIPQMQERMGKHSLEAQNAVRDLRSDLKEVNKNLMQIISEEKDKLAIVDKRLLKLETERGIAVKVITPVVAAITSAVTAFVMGHRP